MSDTQSGGRASSTDDKAAEKTALAVLIAISFCHMLNDTMQSLLLSIYPMLKENYALDFGQVGLITLTFQVTASLLQPMIGLYTDRKPKPYALAIGMSSTLLGLLLLSYRHQLSDAAAGGRDGRHRLVGVPSGILARGAARLRRAAWLCAVPVPGRRQCRLGDRTAGRRLSSSCRAGRARSPGSRSAALVAIIVLMRVGAWYSAHRADRARKAPRAMQLNRADAPAGRRRARRAAGA